MRRWLAALLLATCASIEPCPPMFDFALQWRDDGGAIVAALLCRFVPVDGGVVDVKCHGADASELSDLNRCSALEPDA